MKAKRQKNINRINNLIKEVNFFNYKNLYLIYYKKGKSNRLGKLRKKHYLLICDERQTP